mgnify:CR=1 FL=1
MAHEYTVGVAPELSELENDALAWRAIRRDNLRIDNFVFKFALEQEKYLHSEEHRKQQLLKRIEEIEVNSEPEAASPKPEPETICTADSEEVERMNEETRRLIRKANIRSAIALGIAIAAIVLRIVLTVKQALH